MDVAKSKNEVPIRLTGERWFHITEEHSEIPQEEVVMPDLLQSKNRSIFTYPSTLINAPSNRNAGILSSYDRPFTSTNSVQLIVPNSFVSERS